MARRSAAQQPVTPNAAILYARVSTEEQAREGVSLAAQEERLRAYCAMRGLEIAEVVIDAGVSAGKPLASRDGGVRVLAAIADGRAAAVVALKLDRLFRDASDCLAVTAAWDRSGIALHLVDLGGQAIDTGSAMGRFFLTVMAGAAEMEKNLIRERTEAALAHLKGRGVTLGGEALGWRRTAELDAEGHRVVAGVDDEAATVRRISRLRDAGHTLRAIAETLTAEGRRTKRGGRWYPSTVKAILDREAA